jgi:hypothetical protein
MPVPIAPCTRQSFNRFLPPLAALPPVMVVRVLSSAVTSVSVFICVLLACRVAAV